jgi:hypothetical protein
MISPLDVNYYSGVIWMGWRSFVAFQKKEKGNEQLKVRNDKNCVLWYLMLSLFSWFKIIMFAKL